MDINDPTDAIIAKSAAVMAMVNGETIGVQTTILCNALALILRKIPEENFDPVLELMASTVRVFHRTARVAVAEPVLEPPHDAASSPREENDNARPE